MIDYSEKIASADLSEIAAVGDDAFARSLGYYSGTLQLNPDPILRSQAGGRGIDLYAEMEAKSPNISSDLQTRKLAIIGLDWEVIPASQDAADQDVAAFVGDSLDRIGEFSQDLYQLLDAVGKGYAVSEILWALRPDGKYRIGEIKSRHQRRFVFGADGQLRLLSSVAPTEGVAVPPRKFLVHTFQGEHENPYGTGVLSSIYWYYWFAKNGLKFWALFNEKFGSPTVIGKHPPGADDTVKAALMSVLGSIQQETAITVPDNVIIELLEAKRDGSVTSYQGFLAYLDQACTKRILGQTLTSGEGQRSGSLALGRVHAEVRQDILEADASSLAEVINGQLIPWLVDWNFLVTDYPKLIFKLDPPEDLVQLAKRDLTLQSMGVPIPKSYIQRKYGIPEPEGPDDVLTAVLNSPTVPGAGFSEIFRETDRLLDRREGRP
jgi:phage gp29-like protein